MSISQNILLGSLLILIACGNAKEEQAPKQASILKDTVLLNVEGMGPEVPQVPTYPPSDNDPSYYARKGANQEIYDLMLAAIEELSLGRNHGLIVTPESNCMRNMNDEALIDSMLIGKPKPVKEWQQGDVFNISVTGFSECLAETDKTDMLNQKKKLAGFTWDNARLGFNRAHAQCSYSFSLPLFSKDRSKAILFVGETCRTFGGSAYTVLFEKEDNKWKVARYISMVYY